MLEHVALGQVRFRVPGISPDPRGIALGRYGLLIFSSLDGVVSWFRMYSAESSLDDLMPSLAILRLRSPLGSQSVAVLVPAVSSYNLDRASRCTRLAGGRTYTGTSRHFVRYRDPDSPFGYDLDVAPTIAEGADFSCHDNSFSQEYSKEGTLAFTKLLARLSPRRLPMGRALRSHAKDELWLTVAPGLAEGLVKYLWRNRIDGEAALVRPVKGESKSSFGDEVSSAVSGEKSDGGAPFLLLSVETIPKRILDLCLGTPGISVFRKVAGNIFMQLGFHHLINLAACASLFPVDRVYLFRGETDRVDILPGPLELTPLSTMVPVSLEGEGPAPTKTLEIDPTPMSTVELKLVSTAHDSRRAVATLVPIEKASWVKKMVFLTPESMLRGHKIAVTNFGLLLFADPNTSLFPMGDLLAQVLPSVLVPVGFDIAPRVSPDVLRQALNVSPGILTVFPRDGRPFQIAESNLQPLDRISVAHFETDTARIIQPPEPPGDPIVVNDAIGRFALWGLPKTDSEKNG